MAGEPEQRNPMKEVYFVAGLVVVIVLLWYWSGGAQRADLRGIFLPSPLDTNQGTSTPVAPQFQNSYVAPPETVQY